MKKNNWLICPVCGGKTRNQIREDTVLINYPLFCPKCKQVTLIDVKKCTINLIKEPDAKTQSQ
ncbi:cysteine-rich KTR domain-containing protein [Blautia caecimuris]|uniref:cysteine-rich KTR domain-containing protein n=1 Tax=Lachnospiraceae TaxID=186803 RepID=UPI00203FC0C7|nr:cysteine-rich KTR domain-containing protein [Mediterraneibacter agrestimuris]